LVLDYLNEELMHYNVNVLMTYKIPKVYLLFPNRELFEQILSKILEN